MRQFWLSMWLRHKGISTKCLFVSVNSRCETSWAGPDNKSDLFCVKKTAARFGSS